MADTNSVKRQQSTVIVPEHVEYPSIRINYGSGMIKKRYRVRVITRVFDENDVQVFEQVERALFPEYPADNKMEVTGRLKVDFVESAKPLSEGV